MERKKKLNRLGYCAKIVNRLGQKPTYWTCSVGKIFTVFRKNQYFRRYNPPNTLTLSQWLITCVWRLVSCKVLIFGENGENFPYWTSSLGGFPTQPVHFFSTKKQPVDFFFSPKWLITRLIFRSWEYQKWIFLTFLRLKHKLYCCFTKLEFFVKLYM